MKINEHQAILTPRILLVPYSTHHVPTYHTWMQDEEIQKTTASEPLTIEEEYEMQQSWRQDHDKLTFIACYSPLGPGSDADGENKQVDQIIPQEHDAPEKMIGDVNLFLYEDDEDEEDDQSQPSNPKPIVGELEIMLAAPSSRGRGLAHETLVSFTWYISTYLSSILSEYVLGLPDGDRSERYLKYLRVKIDQGNERSLRLFERLGFEMVGDGANYFGEVEMRRVLSGEKGEEGERRRMVRYGDAVGV